MKQKLSILIFGILLIGCSSPDQSSDNSESTTKSSISFTLNDKSEYVTALENKETFDVTWNKEEVSGTNNSEYGIYALFILKNPSSKDNKDIGSIYFQIITADTKLQTGKTYDIVFKYINSGVMDLPLAYDPTICYTYTDLFKTSQMIGKLKVNSFDGTNLKADFSIENLTNKNPYSDFGYCNGTKIKEKLFNITKGSLNAIPE